MFEVGNPSQPELGSYLFPVSIGLRSHFHIRNIRRGVFPRHDSEFDINSNGRRTKFERPRWNKNTASSTLPPRDNSPCHDIYSQSGNPRDPYPVQSGWQYLKWNVLSIANNSSISSSERSTNFAFATWCDAVHQPQDTNVKTRIRALTTDTFWCYALGNNAYLVNVRPETNQDGVGRDALLLCDRLHDFVVGEGRTGGPKRGVSRDGDPFRLGEFHELGLSARRM